MSESGGYQGFRENSGVGSELNAMRFVMQSMLSEIATAAVVKVAGARSNGEVAPPGTIDVIPLVHQIDGANNAYPHGTIWNVPYVRSQTGGNGIIIDPKPGDVGVIVCASRDISSLKANKGTPSAPGSFRRHDLADAIYVGTMIAAVAPDQYLAFTDDGVVLLSPHAITIQAPTINLVGNIVQSGGSITSNGKHIDNTHVHGGVQPGGSNTSAPVG